MERLHFEIVRMLVAQLAHRGFVGDHTIAWSNWPMTRLPDGSCGSSVGAVVINIQRPDKFALALRAGIHCLRFFNSRFARAHFIRTRSPPDRMPPSHGDSPLCHCAFRVAIGHRWENAPSPLVNELL